MTTIPFSVLQGDDGWYFVSRFGDPAGPYKNKDDALFFLMSHITFLLDDVRKQLEDSYHENHSN